MRPGIEAFDEVGYEDRFFFRRLFKRRTGLKSSEYRKLIQPLANAELTPAADVGSRGLRMVVCSGRIAWFSSHSEVFCSGVWSSSYC